MLKEISDLNPESFTQVSSRFFKYMLRNKVRPTFLKTLFNVNNEESYQQAKDYFSTSYNRTP